MRCAMYLRVSTDEQSTAMQGRELRAFVEARGWGTPALYEDHGFSGTNANRPALKRLLADVRQRKVDIVVCYKLDRLFRSLKDLVTTLQEFKDLGVEFVSLKDAIDMTTASGRLMMQMLGAFAEFEASLIRERVRSGLANAKARGIHIGAPIKDSRDDDKIAELRDAGYSIRGIAAELKIHPCSVQRALKALGS